MRINSALTTAASSFAIGVAALSAPAFAQSTGSIDFDKEIIVTGTRSGTQEVAGVSAPDTAKAKAWVEKGAQMTLKVKSLYKEATGAATQAAA